MNADGSKPARESSPDLNATALEPAWTPDGNFILVKKGGRGGVGKALRACRRDLDVPQGRLVRA
jgi:hypothetical protein